MLAPAAATGAFPSAWVTALALGLFAAGAVAVAGRALLADHGRRAVMARLAVRPGARVRRRRAGAEAAEGLLPPDAPAWRQQLAHWLDEWLPNALTAGDVAERLARAGLHSADAVLLFGAARILAPSLLVLLTLPLAGGAHALPPLVVVALGLAAGLAAPTAVLDRLVARRQTAIRRSLPDVLDLLVVCLEAGVSVDAALQRVARELEPVHPALAEELAAVARRVGAGLPRDEALRGLWARTGVDELRSLTTTMVQAERLGTSLGRVLRVQAEALRTRRRQQAEARAAEASVKMVFPLVVLLLPAFFAVVLGPAVLSMMASFRAP